MPRNGSRIHRNGTRVIDVADVAAVKPGTFRLNRKAPVVVANDGQELTLGMPYKSALPALSQVLAGRAASIQPA